MCGVPLLYNLLHQGIIRAVEEKGNAAVFIFSLLTLLAKAVPSRKFRRRLFGKVHKSFGGRIRFFVSGGAAIDPDVIRAFELFGFILIQGYGLTESAPILTCCTPEKNRVGSVGKPLENVELKFSSGGEIIARGPNIMKGYYKRPDLTAEVLKDGWLYTGDVGRTDRDGYVYITGRTKDVIVTGSGVNIYPEEIEFYLDRLPGIKASCVLGVKVTEGIRKGMEDVWAVIVSDAPELALREQVARLNQKLTDYKRIVNVIIRVEELPRTTTRKVRRFQVRKEVGL